MALVDFTGYDDIRAALGVNLVELKDSALALPLYEDNLLTELGEVSPTLVSVAAAITPPGGTEKEKALLRCLRTFSTYVVAKQLCVSLPLFAPKDVTDGKSATGRFTDPYKATIAAILAEYDKWLARLKAALADLEQGDVVERQLGRRFAISVSTSDPVLGT